MPIDWNAKFAGRSRNLEGNVIREILKLTQQPDIISFAGGMPDPQVFPVAALDEATRRVFAADAAGALQYNTTDGYPPLKQMVIERMKKRGVTVTPEEVLITSGSQQGIELIAKVLLDPGDTVLMENPSYLAAIQIFGGFQARLAAVDIDEQGIPVEGLDEALTRENPKLLYVLPNFQNPTGVSLARERRRALVETAARRGVPVVEDDAYGELRYLGSDIEPIKAFDTENVVLYLGTISKIISPGLRIGWVVGAPEILEKMIFCKQGGDVHTNSLAQRLVVEYYRSGVMESHIDVIRENYGRKRSLMLERMREYFPAGVEWTEPEGGMFVWVTLPPGMSAIELLERAVERKVAFVPGAPFFPRGGGENTLRLNFSNATEENIDAGIRRLGEAMREFLA